MSEDKNVVNIYAIVNKNDNSVADWNTSGDYLTNSIIAPKSETVVCVRQYDVDEIKKASHQFSNGVRVYNATNVNLVFEDIDGTVVAIPPAYDISDCPVMDYHQVPGIGKGKFKGVYRELIPQGLDGIWVISAVHKALGNDTVIIGDGDTINTYQQVYGGIPISAKNYHYRCDMFNVGAKW